MENIYTTVRPFYILIKSMGLFPMSFEGPPRKGFFLTRRTDVAVSCIAGMIPICMIALNLMIEDTDVSTSPFVSRMFVVSAFVGVCAIFVQFWMQIRQRHAILNFLAALNNFDQRTKKLDMTVDFNKHRTVLMRVSLCVASTCILLLQLPFVALSKFSPSGLTLIVTAFYQVLHNFFYAAQFGCAAIAIRSRFRLLNEYLMGFQSSRKVFELKKILIQQKHFDLKLFSELYNELCDAIEMVNATFTNQLVLVFIYMLTIEILAAYGFIREFIQDSDARLLEMMLGCAIFILLQYSIKITLVFAGSTTTKEAEMSTDHLTKLITSFEGSSEVRHDLNFLLLQMKFRKKNLQSIFFTINYHLILAVSSTIVTYLIATSQFDTSPARKV